MPTAATSPSIGWSVEMIDAAEMDHRDLVAAYAREPDLKATLDKHN